VIGARASYVHANEALSYVAGACICNDVSEREYQMERGGTWTKGKGCPTFGPLGPWLVTLDEIADLKTLGMWLDVNGTRMQTGSTATMIFDPAQLVAYVSHFMMLEPGDIITTGTPPGVGMARKPPRFLRNGDVVTLGIAGLGEQRQEIIAFDDWTAKVAAGEPTN
jgi:2,4-diketo-3-deoxy-L-fuconate hydrolase